MMVKPCDHCGRRIAWIAALKRFVDYESVPYEDGMTAVVADLRRRTFRYADGCYPRPRRANPIHLCGEYVRDAAHGATRKTDRAIEDMRAANIVDELFGWRSA